jgi:hypothetical protein
MCGTTGKTPARPGVVCAEPGPNDQCPVASERSEEWGIRIQVLRSEDGQVDEQGPDWRVGRSEFVWILWE